MSKISFEKIQNSLILKIMYFKIFQNFFLRLKAEFSGTPKEALIGTVIALMYNYIDLKLIYELDIDLFKEIWLCDVLN